MRIVGLIPARGGSKGIPRKNLQEINGVPLVGHKILQAQQSYCSEVWVSSEDLEILETARFFEAGTIMRPVEIATDEASTDSVIVHAVNFLRLVEQDILVLLQPTSPLIKVETINQCINKLTKHASLSSVFTVREAHTFSWVQTDGLYWEPYGHDRYNRKRRQELSKSAWETGGCYAFRIGNNPEQVSYHQSPSSVIAVTHLEALDIDTLDDLKDASNVKQ